MLGTANVAGFLQLVSPGSPLVDWESYDPPRQFLVLTSSEQQNLAPSAWVSSVCPRWKSRLSELVLSSQGVEYRHSRKVLGSVSGVESEALDRLVKGFIEFFNGILFHRITSHQATEAIRQVVELCAEKVLASQPTDNIASRAPPLTEISSGKGGQEVEKSKSLKESGIEQRTAGRITPVVSSAQSAHVSPAAAAGSSATAFGTPLTQQNATAPTQQNATTPLHIVFEATPLRVAILDALRWSVEYAVNLSERLAQHASARPDTQVPGSAGTLGIAASASSTKGGGSAQSKTSSVDVARSQQRVLSLLEVVEKTGLLTPVDIIGNLPYSQLDLVAYYTTRDRLSLMKLNVRMRTKDIFTLGVFNLENENPVGYARLHAAIQHFVSKSSSPKGKCGCWKKHSSPGLNAELRVPEVTCPIVALLIQHIRQLIVEFQLCVNRVVHIILLYMEHFLFVLGHSLLDALLTLTSQSRIVDCLMFYLSTYEDALTKGVMRSRSVETLLTSVSSASFLPPSERFYHLCVYLHVEGVVGLNELWNHIGPPESFFEELVLAARQPAAAQQSSSQRDCSQDLAKSEASTSNPCGDAAALVATPNRGGSQYLSMTPAALTPEQAGALLTTQPFGKLNLIVGFIDINAWSGAAALLQRLTSSCPSWSLHLYPPLVQAIGSLLCWLVTPLVMNYREKQSANDVRDENLATVSMDSENSELRTSAVGGYESPYSYGASLHRDNCVRLQPATSELAFRLVCVPLFELLGPALGSLSPSVLEFLVDAFGEALRNSIVTTDSSIPSCYCHIVTHVIFPAMALAEPRVTLAEKVWKALAPLTVAQRFSLYANFFYRVRPYCVKLVTTAQAVRRTVGRELKRVTAEQSDTRGPSVLFTTSGGGHSVMGEIVVKQKPKTTHQERSVMDCLLKLCCANPFEVMDVILHQVEMFDNMLIRVIINYLPLLPALCCDITVFLVTERQHCREVLESGVWSPSKAKPKRLRNLAHFIARFLRRFPTVEARPLLLSVAARILQEITEPSYPHQLTGKYCDIAYLEELITWMGGVPLLATEELSVDQVDCLGAGPNLRVMMLVDGNRREELYRSGSWMARSRLREALLQKDVFPSLLLGLSKLRLEVQYDAQLRCESKSLQLRSVAALTDEVQLSLLQVIDFILLPENNNLLLQPLDQPDKKELSIFTLSQHPKNFAAVLPAFSDIVRFCEPALTWLLVRATLNPIYSLPDSVPENEVVAEAELRIPGHYPLTEIHLTRLAQRYFLEPYSGLGDLYLTFWRLDLQDIWIPDAVYTKQIALIGDALKQIASERRSLSSASVSQKQPATNTTSTVRRSAADDGMVQKELDVMVQRLNDLKKTFEAEWSVLKQHKERVLESLKTRKHRWFHPDCTGPKALTHFLQHMIAVRLLNSQKDALYCTKFVHMLVDLDTEGFYLIDFFNKWTGMLTPLVRSCSIQEADYLGLFVNDMTAIINQWIRKPSLLLQCARENRTCYARLVQRKPAGSQTAGSSNLSEEAGFQQVPPTLQDPLLKTADTDVDMSGAVEENSGGKLSSSSDSNISSAVDTTSDLLKVIGKWENRIFRVIQHGLSLTEKETSWMSQRIVIKFLNKTHKNFPITDVAGTQILRSLPPLIERAKEARWDDVVANARALDRNLRVVEPQWLKRKEDDEEDRRRAVSQSSASRGTSVVSAVDDSANSEHTDTKKTTAPQNGAAESRNNDPPSTSNPSVLRSSSPSGGPGTAASLVNASNTSTLKSASAGGLGKGPKNPFHNSLAETPRLPTAASNNAFPGGRVGGQNGPGAALSSGGPRIASETENKLLATTPPSELAVPKRPCNSLALSSASPSSVSKRQKTEPETQQTTHDENILSSVVHSEKVCTATEKTASNMPSSPKATASVSESCSPHMIPSLRDDPANLSLHPDSSNAAVKAAVSPAIPIPALSTSDKNDNPQSTSLPASNSPRKEVVAVGEKPQTKSFGAHQTSDASAVPQSNMLPNDKRYNSSPVLAASGPPLTMHEIEERKFEKQKEIDALRQRMKSLHTHRSQSSSAHMEGAASASSPAESDRTEFKSEPRKSQLSWGQAAEARNSQAVHSPSPDAGGHRSAAPQAQVGDDTQKAERKRELPVAQQQRLRGKSLASTATASSHGALHSNTSTRQSRQEPRLSETNTTGGTSRENRVRQCDSLAYIVPKSNDSNAAKSARQPAPPASGEVRDRTVSRQSWSSGRSPTVTSRTSADQKGPQNFAPQELCSATSSLQTSYRHNFPSSPSSFLSHSASHSSFPANTSRGSKQGREEENVVTESGRTSALGCRGTPRPLVPPPPPPPPPPMLLPPPPPRSQERIVDRTSPGEVREQSSRTRSRGLSPARQQIAVDYLAQGRQKSSSPGGTRRSRTSERSQLSTTHNAQVVHDLHSSTRYVSRRQCTTANGNHVEERSLRFRSDSAIQHPVSASSAPSPSSWVAESAATPSHRDVNLWYKGAATQSTSQWNGTRTRGRSESRSPTDKFETYPTGLFSSSDTPHGRQHRHRSGTSSSSSASNQYHTALPYHALSKRHHDQRERSVGLIRSRSASRADISRRRHNVHDSNVSAANADYYDRYGAVDPHLTTRHTYGGAPSSSAFKHNQERAGVDDARLRSIRLSPTLPATRPGSHLSTRRH